MKLKCQCPQIVSSEGGHARARTLSVAAPRFCSAAVKLRDGNRNCMACKAVFTLWPFTGNVCQPRCVVNIQRASDESMRKRECHLPREEGKASGAVTLALGRDRGHKHLAFIYSSVQ